MLPVDRLPPQDWLEWPESRTLMAALSQPAAPARYVGGAVRDAVLGRPVRDVDVATPLPPAAVAERLARAGLRAIPTGLDHGTVTAVVGGRSFEITTLRHDVETFGRHARVAFTDDWAADAARRDFTMNALYCDPDGTLYDPTGGLADARAGIVRFVGDAAARIAEDHLRILRFFRLHAWYGRGRPERGAMRACRDHRADLDRLSGERIRNELLRLLAAPDPRPVLAAMARAGVRPHVFGTDDVRTDRLGRLMAAEAARGEADPVRRLAALLAGRPDAVAWLVARLKPPAAEAARLARLAVPGRLAASTPAARRRLLYREGAAVSVDLAMLAGRPGLAGELERTPVPVFPLRGRDVLELGLASGPEVGRLLAAVERWWAARDFAPDRDRCLDRLRRLAGGRATVAP